MNKIHEQLTTAADEAARVVANTRPEQFGDKTACTQWDVKELLNHLILWTSYSFERRARSEQVGPDLTDRDFASEPDYAQRYRDQLDRALAAWEPDEVWAGQVDTGSGTMPAPQIAEMILMELVLHAWDLATATGQSYNCPDDVAATVAKAVADAAEMYREYDGFAAEVEVPADASVFDKALAVSGRRPVAR
ncbi:MAG: TIGR03086 family protein [Catenulispora sp.]|nr:TIGR03086 family protein [Catenulispora sp.]